MARSVKIQGSIKDPVKTMTKAEWERRQKKAAAAKNTKGKK
jgi:hypothetical protein